jgi:tripartite-type tricarboxylate transporter receptor subunit TctC
MNIPLAARWSASLAGLALLMLGLLQPIAATAQDYPVKPIRFVIPFTAGSGTDIIGRAVAQAMQKSLGQTIVVENKPGAGGTLAAGLVVKGEADGYTVLVHSAGHALNPAIYPNLNYDTVNDFAGVTTLASLPNVLVVPPQRGWKTVSDLIEAAKAKPGALNYASAGSGSATHLNAEKFRLLSGIEAVHVPFKGTPEALTEIAAGRLDWFFAPLASALPLLRDGRLLALAVSTHQRSAQLPAVPTTIEAGLPNSDYLFWVGMLVPAKTPRAIVQRLADEAAKALATQEVSDRFAALGAQALPMKPEQFDSFIKSEIDAAARIAKAARLQAP